MPGKLQRDSGMDLRIRGKGGWEGVVEDVEGRDEVFRRVVGVSGSEWQVVW